MIKRFFESFGFCFHDWEIFEKMYIYERADAGDPHEVVFVRKCAKCGKLDQYRVK